MFVSVVRRRRWTAWNRVPRGRKSLKPRLTRAGDAAKKLGRETPPSAFKMRRERLPAKRVKVTCAGVGTRFITMKFVAASRVRPRATGGRTGSTARDRLTRRPSPKEIGRCRRTWRARSSALGRDGFSSPRIVSPWDDRSRRRPRPRITAVEDGASSVAGFFRFSVSSYSAAARRIIPPYSSKNLEGNRPQRRRRRPFSGGKRPPFTAVYPPFTRRTLLSRSLPSRLFASLSSRSTRARRSSIEMRSFPFRQRLERLARVLDVLGADRPGSVSASSVRGGEPSLRARVLLWSGPWTVVPVRKQKARGRFAGPHFASPVVMNWSTTHCALFAKSPNCASHSTSADGPRVDAEAVLEPQDRVLAQRRVRYHETRLAGRGRGCLTGRAPRDDRAQYSTEWRWLNVPRSTSWPLRRTWQCGFGSPFVSVTPSEDPLFSISPSPSCVSSVPNAKSSAVPQSTPVCSSTIALRCDRSFRT